MFDDVAIGVLTSVLSAKTKEVIDAALSEKGASIEDLLKTQNAILIRMLDQLSAQDNPDLTEIVTLQANPATSTIESGQFWTVPEYSRNHLMIYNPVSSGNLIVQIPGLQVMGYGFSNPMWYQADFPTGTKIASSVYRTIMIQWSDFAHGASL
jgi:hypothetical protein